MMLYMVQNMCNMLYMYYDYTLLYVYRLCVKLFCVIQIIFIVRLFVDKNTIYGGRVHTLTLS